MWFQTADIDEKSIRRENPDDLVMVLAEAKVDIKMPCFFSPPLVRQCSALCYVVASDLQYYRLGSSAVTSSCQCDDLCGSIANALLGAASF